MTISQHIYPPLTEVQWQFFELLIPQAPTNFCQNLHPSISAWTTHGLSLITSPSKMPTVLIRRNAPNDSCHNLTALMSLCTQTSFIITPHYICAHRNSDNLHNADFVGNSAVWREWRTCTFWWSYAICNIMTVRCCHHLHATPRIPRNSIVYIIICDQPCRMRF